MKMWERMTVKRIPRDNIFSLQKLEKKLKYYRVYCKNRVITTAACFKKIK